jgi:hypothetical protein
MLLIILLLFAQLTCIWQVSNKIIRSLSQVVTRQAACNLCTAINDDGVYCKAYSNSTILFVFANFVTTAVTAPRS